MVCKYCKKKVFPSKEGKKLVVVEIVDGVSKPHICPVKKKMPKGILVL